MMTGGCDVAAELPHSGELSSDSQDYRTDAEKQTMSTEAASEYGLEGGNESQRRSSWSLDTIMVPLTYVRSLVDGVGLTTLTSLASAYYHAGEDKVTIASSVSNCVFTAS